MLRDMEGSGRTREGGSMRTGEGGSRRTGEGGRKGECVCAGAAEIRGEVLFYFFSVFFLRGERGRGEMWG